MSRGKKTIALKQLALNSASDLAAMVNELKSSSEAPSQWSRRFSASGKGGCAFAPRVRV